MTNWSALVDSILEPLLQLDGRIGAGMKGCTPDDVALIEEKFSIELPGAFRALLGKFGRCRGNFMRGADFGFPEILGFREVAESLLKEVEMELAPSDFVFEMEQGYQFFYFSTTGEDDPVVHFYDDGNPEFVSLGVSLTGWLRICVDEELGLWKAALVSEGEGIEIRWLSGNKIEVY